MVNRAIVLILISIFSSTDTKANGEKDYRIYHQRVIEAEDYIATENYKEALQVYQELFKKYDFVFLREYQVATQLAMHLGMEQEAIKYLKKGISSGWQMKSIKRNQYLVKLRKTKAWKSIKRQYHNLHEQYQSNINEELREQVKKMFSRDQWKAIGALFKIGSKAQDRYAEQKFAPHSEQQMAEVSAIFKKFGYPGEQIIGNDFWMSTIMSHHNSISQQFVEQDTLYPSLKPQLKKALRNGQISPYEFASIDEWHRLVKDERNTAAYGIIKPPTKQNISITNGLRKECYMRPVELRNKLVELQGKSGMDFYLQENQWIKGKLEIE